MTSDPTFRAGTTFFSAARATQGRIAKLLRRVADRLDPKPAPVVRVFIDSKEWTAKYAAEMARAKRGRAL